MKYRKEVVSEICQAIREGATKEEAAKRAGIHRDTLFEWQKRKGDFSDALKQAEAEYTQSVVADLERSLIQRAKGYTVTETKTDYTTDKNGNVVIQKQTETTKTFAADTGAMIFALSNLSPEKWQNKQKVETTEIKAEGEKEQYNFADVPEDVLFAMADKMQDAEFDREKKRREGDGNG